MKESRSYFLFFVCHWLPDWLITPRCTAGTFMNNKNATPRKTRLNLYVAYLSNENWNTIMSRRWRKTKMKRIGFGILASRVSTMIQHPPAHKMTPPLNRNAALRGRKWRSRRRRSVTSLAVFRLFWMTLAFSRSWLVAVSAATRPLHMVALERGRFACCWLKTRVLWLFCSVNEYYGQDESW